MATFQTEDGEVEMPLFPAHPEIVYEMRRLMDTVEKHMGTPDMEVVGLKEAPDGGLRVVLRKKQDA